MPIMYQNIKIVITLHFRRGLFMWSTNPVDYLCGHNGTLYHMLVALSRESSVSNCPHSANSGEAPTPNTQSVASKPPI